MYDTADTLRGTPRQRERPPRPDPRAAARQALVRVRRLFDDFFVGAPLDAERLASSLDAPFTVPAHEAERLLALGRLAWLGGDNTRAADLLAQADAMCKSGVAPADTDADVPALEPALLATHAAAWLARLRLTLHDGLAVADYELALRRLGGQPRATAYYADLLWRQGRVDRAEQVWKSLRANKRVTACDEAPLLEARIALRRGDFGAAERHLRESSPAGGPAHAERSLLLAWLFAAQKKADGAREALDAAAKGVYPQSSLAAFRAAVEARLAGEHMSVHGHSPAWQAFFAAQKRRAEGDAGAADDYRTAMTSAAVAPFARYGLACLGHEDAAAALEAQTEPFFGCRARLRVQLAKFLRGELPPADALAAIEQATRAGIEDTTLAHLAHLARLTTASPDDLVAAVESLGEDDARSRNVLRACLRADLPREALAALKSVAILPAEVAATLTRAALQFGDPSLLPAGDPVARSLLANSPFPEVSPEAAVERAVLAGTRPLPGLPAHPALVDKLTSRLAELRDGGAAPPGTDPAAWRLHLVAKALRRGDFAEAETLLPDGHPLRAVLAPAADGSRLAAAMGVEAAVAADLASRLAETPDGPAVLDAARRGDTSAVVVGLQRLVGSPGLSPRVAHHLAVWSLGRANALEAEGSPMAVSFHQDTWRALLPALADRSVLPADAGDVLVSHLLDGHRRSIAAAVRRNDMGTARGLYRLVTGLAADDSLSAKVADFRERCETEALTSSREALQIGEIPQGWKGNHELAVALLLRRLALEPESVRLLTALMEACNVWFLDLYHLQDFDRLLGELDRIADHVETLHAKLRGPAGEDAARAALSDILKVRGFLSRDPRAKRADYAEAVRLHPGNANAKTLLAEMGEEE